MSAAVPPIDLLAGDFYGEPAKRAYAWMREHSRVHHDDVNDLWGVATYAGVLAVGRDPGTFSNAGGTRPDTGPLPWMIDMDAPDHLKRRKLVNRGFTPARVRATEPHLVELCDDLIDRVDAAGECDVVRDLAAPLPVIVIGDMLGMPAEDRPKLLEWSDALIGSLGGTPEAIEAAATAYVAFDAYARDMIAARRREPTDDLVSVFVHAEVDGDHLDDGEIVYETLLLLVGGDESTRHVISGGLEALLRHPDERRKVVDDPALLPCAVEEMLRWVSPVKNMTRTVTRDTVLEGQELPAGAKLLLLYESADYDEAQFGEPTRFDVTRSPNDHLAFGNGSHFCLGASLARLEIQTMVARVLERLPGIELADEATDPDALPRHLGALTSLPVTFAPTGAAS
jgi:cytochrome P450 family 142 subfamily A polypeptide 1